MTNLNPGTRRAAGATASSDDPITASGAAVEGPRPSGAGSPISPWCISWRADPRARVLADRHYNRQSVGAAQFVPPGRCLVLLTPDAGALWVTSWPLPEYVKHEWAGAWINSCFRREHGEQSSDLIRAAVAATVARWPDIPELGMVTFVDAGKVRTKRDPGRCYLRAGFKLAGKTKSGLLAFQMLPGQMPDAVEADPRQLRLAA